MENKDQVLADDVNADVAEAGAGADTGVGSGAASCTMENDAVAEICSLLAVIQDEKLIRDFFGCLFTPAELKDFSNRWHLIKELDAGTTQREIAKKYSMSLCNITRGSKELKKEDSAFRKVLDILKEKNREI